MAYFPTLRLDDVHQCLLHVDSARCGDPFQDWFRPALDQSELQQLNAMTARTLLKKYADKEASITPSPDCLIGVGYNSCKDIGFSAKSLFRALAPEINQLTDSSKGAKKIVAKVHNEINDFESFV